MNYYAVLTDHGAQLIEQAYQHGQVVTITQMAIGDGGGVELEPATSALAVAGEFDRVPLTSGASASSMLGGGVDYESQAHVGKWIRTLGLMDAQGNLIVYSNYPPTYIADKGSTLFRTLGLNIQLPIVHGDAVTVIVERPPYPPATETEYGVVKLATQQQANSGVDDLTAITPKKLRAVLKADGLTAFGSAMIGVPISWPLAQMPQDIWPDCGMVFLSCSGQGFNKATYSKLAQCYPSGVIPDLRSEFIRGWDNGRLVDTGRSLLSAQGDAIREIAGTITADGIKNATQSAGLLGSGVFTGVGGAILGQALQGIDYAAGVNHRTMNFKASNVVPTAADNRPRNIAFNYIMRAA
ncbi:phage tail-collar fiber domain-containing protein [Aeromonas veronii]